MKNFESLKECLRYRINEDEDNYYYVTLWEEEVRLACSDINSTIEYIKNDCTDEELWWFGEVMEDVIRQSNSSVLVEVLTERGKRVADDQKRADILEDISTASGALEK